MSLPEWAEPELQSICTNVSGCAYLVGVELRAHA
jgi:hypothetical protein